MGVVLFDAVVLCSASECVDCQQSLLLHRAVKGNFLAEPFTKG